MKAVILAAGIGSRLNSITAKKPKCMIKVGGRPILNHQIQAYTAAGIKNIIIIAGHKINQIREYSKKIKGINIKIIENKDYKTTNNMYSLYLAKDKLQGNDFLLSNGDVVFDPKIITECLNSNMDDAILCDKDSYNKESMKISVDRFGYVNDINKKISPAKAYGTSIDIYKFSSESSYALFEEISRYIERENEVNLWTEVAMKSLLNKGNLKMNPFNINKKKWVEIDDLNDLISADKFFSKIKTIKKKKQFFIDLDGTVYLENELIKGARELVHKLKKLNKYVYFLSNNSSKAKIEYVKKLNRMGINSSEKEIILSTDGVVNFLQKKGVMDIFVVGTRSMRSTFERAGLNVESIEPKYVVLGYDTELTYSKLRKASLFLERGIELIATHPDIVCPSPEGFIPDIGSILALFERATGKKPIKIFGKPNPEMISYLMNKSHISKKETIIIGDRLYTDMELAKRVGCNFVCVLSGESSREEIEESPIHPDIIVKNIGELIDFL